RRTVFVVNGAGAIRAIQADQRPDRLCRARRLGIRQCDVLGRTADCPRSVNANRLELPTNIKNAAVVAPSVAAHANPDDVSDDASDEARRSDDPDPDSTSLVQ